MSSELKGVSPDLDGSGTSIQARRNAVKGLALSRFFFALFAFPHSPVDLPATAGVANLDESAINSSCMSRESGNAGIDHGGSEG